MAALICLSYIPTVPLNWNCAKSNETPLSGQLKKISAKYHYICQFHRIQLTFITNHAKAVKCAE